jgi:hypothetical protein
VWQFLNDLHCRQNVRMCFRPDWRTVCKCSVCPGEFSLAWWKPSSVFISCPCSIRFMISAWFSLPRVPSLRFLISVSIKHCRCYITISNFTLLSDSEGTHLKKIYGSRISPHSPIPRARIWRRFILFSPKDHYSLSTINSFHSINLQTSLSYSDGFTFILFRIHSSSLHQRSRPTEQDLMVCH